MATIRKWLRRGAIVAFLIIAVVVVIVLLVVQPFGGGGDGDGNGFSEEASSEPIGDLVIDSVAFTQEGEVHEVAPGNLEGEIEDFVLEPGPVGVVIHYTDEEGNSVAGETVTHIDEEGNEHEVTLDEDSNAIFSINLTIDDTGWRFNEFTIKVDSDEKKVKVLAIKPSPNGLTGGDMVNTATELGVAPDGDQPRTTVDLEVSDLFLDAFAKFCGFGPEEVKKLTLLPTDRPTFQVGWDGRSFVQSRNVIPEGQPIWTLISEDNEKCRINPPCGNPEVVKGKLKVAPPGAEVSPPPPPGRKPPATPPPPGRTPPPTLPPGVTPPPTATPPTPPPPTSTPVTPRCLVTILGPSRVDNTSTQARMQATAQWDQQPNFSETISWYLDGTFIGGGQSIQFMATLDVTHTLTVKVFNGAQVVCQDSAVFSEGSIPPGDDGPGSPPIPDDTPIPAPPPTTDPDDGFEGPQ